MVRGRDGDHSVGGRGARPLGVDVSERARRHAGSQGHSCHNQMLMSTNCGWKRGAAIRRLQGSLHETGALMDGGGAGREHLDAFTPAAQ